jgi:leucyl aminopeptidase (aminopeptidase T)
MPHYGPAPADLMPGALNAVNTCLAIQPGERVALIADEASREVAASLEQALAERGARAECLLIESVSARPVLAAPPQLLELPSVSTLGSCACSRKKVSSPRAWPSSPRSSGDESATPTWSA